VAKSATSADAARASVLKLLKGATSGGWPAPGRSWAHRHELEARFKDNQIDDLVLMARAGDLDADDALRDRLAGCLVKLSENDMPASLRDWAMQSVFERRVSDGRAAATNRDLLILMMVQHVVTSFSLSPTRSPGSEGPSGCSVVADVLPEVGLDLTESGVVDIWRRRRTIFPTGFPSL
jgi:hypothetical protein